MKVKSLNRWENTFARRAVLSIVFLPAMSIVMVGGAYFGLEEAVKELWGGVCAAWKGPRYRKWHKDAAWRGGKGV